LLLLLLLLLLHAWWQGRGRRGRVGHSGGRWGEVGVVTNDVRVVHGGKAARSGLGLGTKLKREEVLTHDMGFRNVVGCVSMGVTAGYVHSLSD